MINLLPSEYRCSAIGDFIGDARLQAQRVVKIADKSRELSKAAVKLLILGSPGIGKSEIANLFSKHMGVSKWSECKFNGTQLKIEQVEDLARTVQMTNMYGDYRVIRVEEIDAVPKVAQVRLLTLLDDLPRGNAFIGTSNCSIKQLEMRFQRRFQVINLKPPSDGEINSLLIEKFRIPKAISMQIASLSNGSVGQALMDAQSYLMS